MRDQHSATEPASEVAAAAAAILAGNRYLVLSTADRDGRPWASPVYFAAEGTDRFLWVSRPGSEHSRNIAARPEVAIVVFDSSVPPGQTAAFYATGIAEEVPPDAVEGAVAVYSDRSVADGLPPWTVETVSAPSEFRLFRARVVEASVLMPGREKDFRTPL
jgi:nitroimidazol reductase NimA-like FMN-containing flavoprotein (pyridoxamine 5'-phosphate oxidase superfamily)